MPIYGGMNGEFTSGRTFLTTIKELFQAGALPGSQADHLTGLSMNITRDCCAQKTVMINQSTALDLNTIIAPGAIINPDTIMNPDAIINLLIPCSLLQCYNVFPPP